MGLYFFLVLYAVTLFLLAAVLVPRSWDGVTVLDDYLIAKRAWFFPLAFFANALDVLDAYLKGGWSYVYEMGPWTWSLWILLATACVMGVGSTDRKRHTLLALAIFVGEVGTGFETLPRLGF